MLSAAYIASDGGGPTGLRLILVFRLFTAHYAYWSLVISVMILVWLIFYRHE